jgi:hypothetical protein
MGRPGQAGHGDLQPANQPGGGTGQPDRDLNLVARHLCVKHSIMLTRAWKLIVLLALFCGPLVAMDSQPVQAIGMADCGELPAGHSGKSTVMDHCIAGCAFVIPLADPVPVKCAYAEEIFELPTEMQTSVAGEVATPPPK